jgi:hypothetical protein
MGPDHVVEMVVVVEVVAVREPETRHVVLSASLWVLTRSFACSGRKWSMPGLGSLFCEHLLQSVSDWETDVHVMACSWSELVRNSRCVSRTSQARAYETHPVPSALCVSP